jgi:type I restriction enzyme S subunit
MKLAIPRVPFVQFLKPNSRVHTLAADQDANLVGMRWYGGGPFHREYKSAHKIQKKSHFVIRRGDVIYNKLFAWKGAFGVVPDDLDGMFVSDKFPTYELDRERVHPAYLTWFFKHHDAWEQARKKSKGSAAISKLTLNPSQFLELEIPLPVINAQVKVVERLNYCSGRIHEAKKIQEWTALQIKRLTTGAANAILGAAEIGSRLGDVLLGPPRNGWSPKCDNKSDGVPVLTLSAVTGWRYKPSAIKRTSLPTTTAAHYWLTKGDLLITRSNTPELVGHVAIFDGSPSPSIYPDLMMKLRVDPTKADARFVWWWMQTARVREYIKKSAKGSSPTMKKISQGVVANTPFPERLTVSQQYDIARQLDALQTKVSSVTRFHDETGTALGALLPAVLDQAFRGEL